MTATSIADSALVIDSNIAVWLVLPEMAAQGIDVAARFAGWTQAGFQLLAPTLWMAECTSAVRTGVYMRTYSLERAQQALRDLIALDIDLIPLTGPLCLAALDWAGRLNQAKAYDAFYLALADAVQAEFWTADRRLANAAQQAGATSAHWIGES